MALERAFEADELLVGGLCGIVAGSADPSTALVNAPTGTLYLRTNGETWQKVTALPNGWQRLEAGTAFQLPDWVIADDELVFVDDELVEA